LGVRSLGLRGRRHAHIGTDSFGGFRVRPFHHGHEVEQLISQTISNWDAEETSRKIELHVGKDLQFIRINGTLVGGLVGLVIYTISLWL